MPNRHLWPRRERKQNHVNTKEAGRAMMTSTKLSMNMPSREKISDAAPTNTHRIPKNLARSNVAVEFAPGKYAGESLCGLS